MKYLLIILGLITANLLCAEFLTHDYAKAFDRSFFQATALFAYWILP